MARFYVNKETQEIIQVPTDPKTNYVVASALTELRSLLAEKTKDGRFPVWEAVGSSDPRLHDKVVAPATTETAPVKETAPVVAEVSPVATVTEPVETAVEEKVEETAPVVEAKVEESLAEQIENLVEHAVQEAVEHLEHPNPTPDAA